MKNDNPTNTRTFKYIKDAEEILKEWCGTEGLVDIDERRAMIIEVAKMIQRESIRLER